MVALLTGTAEYGTHCGRSRDEGSVDCNKNGRMTTRTSQDDGTVDVNGNARITQCRTSRDGGIVDVNGKGGSVEKRD